MIVAVVPAHNEEKRIGNVIKKSRRFVDRVIVIDDGSTDETGKVARKAGAVAVRIEKNSGKGRALRAGVEVARKLRPDKLVFLDGDGQHRAEDIPKFLEKLEKSEVVFGQRVGGDMPPVKRFGNWFLQKMFNFLFGYSMGDTQCGFKAIRAEVIDRLMWESNGYFMDTEMAARASASNLRIGEVKIPSVYHDPSKGTTVTDGVIIGVKMIWLKLKLLFS